MAGQADTQRTGTPWWVVLGVFVVLPVLLAFFISRQAAAQQVRRKAVASSHGWAIENKNEGQRVWILRGSHGGFVFEATELLREGGGSAYRVRFPIARTFPSWSLVRFQLADFQPRDFGTISTLVRRDAFPAAIQSPFDEVSMAGDAALLSEPKLLELLRPPPLVQLAVSFVDDGVVLDGTGPLPEGEALVPLLDYAARLAAHLSPDAG